MLLPDFLRHLDVAAPIPSRPVGALPTEQRRDQLIAIANPSARTAVRPLAFRVPQVSGEEVRTRSAAARSNVQPSEHRPFVGLAANPIGPTRSPCVGQPLGKLHHPVSKNRSNSSMSSLEPGRRIRLRLDGVSPNSTASFRKASSDWLATVR